MNTETKAFFFNIPRAQKYRDKRKKNTRTEPEKNEQIDQTKKQVEEKGDSNKDNRIAENKKQKDKQSKRIDRACIRVKALIPDDTVLVMDHLKTGGRCHFQQWKISQRKTPQG